MRYVTAIMGVGVLAVAAGCQSPAHQEESHAPFNAWTMDELTTREEHNAIVRQRTIYPYHFVPDSAELTPVGERDVAVLADHFAGVPGGRVNLRRGETPDGLYAARTETLRRAFADRGVTAEAVAIGDDLPGGSGMSARRAMIVLERSEKAVPASSTLGQTGGVTNTTGGR